MIVEFNEQKTERVNMTHKELAALLTQAGYSVFVFCWHPTVSRASQHPFKLASKYGTFEINHTDRNSFIAIADPDLARKFEKYMVTWIERSYQAFIYHRGVPGIPWIKRKHQVLLYRHVAPVIPWIERTHYALMYYYVEPSIVWIERTYHAFTTWIERTYHRQINSLYNAIRKIYLDSPRFIMRMLIPFPLFYKVAQRIYRMTRNK